MSVIDPSKARQARLDDSSPRTRTDMIVGYAIGVPLAVLGGVGAAALFATLRESFVLGDGAETEAAGLWLVPVGVFGGLIGGGVALTFAGNRERRLRARATPSLAPFTLGLAGTAAGVVLGTMLWRQPAEPGSNVDYFHGVSTWGFGSWLLYTATWWFPALFILGALAALFAWRRSEQRNARLTAERDRLLRQGSCVIGTVTDVRVHYSTDDTGSQRVSGATGVVRYLDSDGVERWVTRTSLDASHVADGAQARVLFDPLAPGDGDRIFVAFQREPALTDWIAAPPRPPRPDHSAN